MKRIARFLRYLVQRVWVAGGALALTFLFFLVLPLMQSIQSRPTADMMVRAVDTAFVPPPPPPPEEEEPEKEEEPEEEPPELEDDTPPLDLDQLELALNPGLGGDWVSGDFAIKLTGDGGDGKDVDALFSLADLDQQPRVIHQPSPEIDRALRKRAPGTVYVIFIVDERGRVESPMVQKSSDPIFERSALAAVKRWKFEPGKRGGKPVRSRMRVPITFPKED